jgi:hypothetical protein
LWRKFFKSIIKNTLAYYNSGALIVNTEVVGLAPGFLGEIKEKRNFFYVECHLRWTLRMSNVGYMHMRHGSAWLLVHEAGFSMVTCGMVKCTCGMVKCT